MKCLLALGVGRVGRVKVGRWAMGYGFWARWAFGGVGRMPLALALVLHLQTTSTSKEHLVLQQLDLKLSQMAVLGLLVPLLV